MIFKKTKIEGLYIIEPVLIKDNRGYFTRNFCLDELKKKGLDFQIAQANLSFTKKRGTIRGMHFQREPKSEGKIVQCLRGGIYDVAVDMRPKSKTYLKWFAIELTEKNKKMLYIPKGFAHGFQTLSNNCEVFYFMSEFYSPEYAIGVRWNDPVLKIKWPVFRPVLSKKDKAWSLIIL